MLLFPQDVFPGYVDSQYIWSIEIVDRSSLAALVVLVWDTCLCLHDEIALIWFKSWRRWIKWVFIFVRYFALIALGFLNGIHFFRRSHHTLHFGRIREPRLSSSLCHVWFLWQALGLPILMTTVEGVLIIRVHILFGRNWLVTRTIIALFILELCAMATSVALIFNRIQYETVAGCYVTLMPKEIVIYAAAAIAFESVLLLLTLFKFVQTAHRAGWASMPVLTAFTRDGVAAFATIFVALVVNSGLYTSSDNIISGIGLTWMFTILSVVGCRVLLSTQRLAVARPHAISTWEYDTRPDDMLDTSNYVRWDERRATLASTQLTATQLEELSVVMEELENESESAIQVVPRRSTDTERPLEIGRSEI